MTGQSHYQMRGVIVTMHCSLNYEGEWVLTKEEANILRSYGGLEGMIGMIDRNSSNVSVNVQNQNKEFDYEKFGRAAAEAMIAAGIGFKCDEREFARLIKDLIDYV